MLVVTEARRLDRIDSERLASLIDQSGISQRELGARVGLTQQAIGKLKNGRTRETPKLDQIAKALKTTPDYLRRKSDNPEGVDTGPLLSSEEREWLDLFQLMTPDQRKAIRLLARTFVVEPPSTRIHDRRQDYRAPDQE